MSSPGGTNVGGIYYDITADTSGLIGQTRVVDRETAKMAGSFNVITKAIGIMAAAMAAVKIARLADDIRMLAARVEVAAGSVERGAAAFGELVNISRRTQSSLEGNIEVFNRLNQSILAMGGTQTDTLQVTELLGKAIKVSGASAVEAKAAMLQFGQALGSGKLQGDELRSLMETAPYLMRQLADGIGVPVGALKKLGEEGKLTADVVTNALTKAAAKIDEDFKKLPQTLEAAMVVAQDQAALAALKFDDLVGGSAVLAGVVRGLGEVLEHLGNQFASATGEADKLGRSSTVKTWGDGTITVLSYVADAADFVTRMFRQMGTLIGGVAAAAAQLASGEVVNTAKTVAKMRQDILDIGNAKYSGAKMRQAMEAPQADLKPGGSKLRAPAGSAAEKPKFDSLAYIAGLEKAAAEGYAKVDAIEKEGYRKTAELLKAGKISREQAALATVLIEEEAARARQDIGRKELAELQKDFKTSSTEILAMERQLVEERKKAIEYAAGLTRAVNPIDALRQEYEAKLDLVRQYEEMMALAGVDATERGIQARAEIENQYRLQRLALAEQTFRSQSEENAFLMDSLNALSSTASGAIVGLLNGTMSAQDAMRALANTVLNEAVSALVQIGIQQIKNALVANTVAAADKARAAANGAVYAASVSAQVAGMSAMAAQNAFAATAAIPIIGPGLAPAAAAAAAAASAAIGAPAVATAPVAGARQYGGPVDAGKLYRVNETGKPEMFTASNGSQYMMPTKSGSVTPADKVGGGAPVVIIENHGAPLQVQSQTFDQQSNTVRLAVAAVADQISSNSGQVWTAMRSATNVQGRL